MAKRRKNTTPEHVEEVKSEVVSAEEVVEATPVEAIAPEPTPVDVSAPVEVKPEPVKEKKSSKNTKSKDLVLARGQKLVHKGDECTFIEPRGSKVIVRKGIAFLLVEKESLSMP